MNIRENLQEIQEKIKEAKAKSPNPNQDVTLVAVTKNHNVEEIMEVVQCGQLILGENRVQELKDKYPQISSSVEWHLIGHLQSNKVKYITDKVKLIHSLESKTLAEELNKRMLAQQQVMDCLVQVNIADEDTKYGLAIDKVIPFIQEISEMDGIKIKGLMNIAPNMENVEDVRPIFRGMYQLFNQVSEMAIPNVSMEILSMGMTNDYHIAIEEGANMVRVGSGIFK